MPTILVPSASYVLSDHLPTSEGDHCYNLFKHTQEHDYLFHAISEHVDIKTPLANLKAYSVGTFKAQPSPNPAKKYLTHAEFLTRSTLKATRLLSQTKIDIVHHVLPTVHNQTISPLALTGKTQSHPFIIGPASAHFYRRSTDERILQTLTTRLHRATVQKADRLVTITQQVKDLYKGTVEEDKIEVIPLAVDTTLFKPTDTEDDGNTILYVGSLYPLKGVHHLIEAMNTIVQERPKTTLKIVGDGPQRPALKNLIRHHRLQKNISIHDAVPHSQTPQHYQSCSVFCFPTQGEPFGKAIIEAMACSKPVVATNTGGPKEIVVDGETGFLVPLAQPNVLAQKLLTLLTDESLRKKMGEKARNTALACFSWHRISEKYHRLYKSLL